MACATASSDNSAYPLARLHFDLPSKHKDNKARRSVEAALYDSEPCANRSGILIGMAACAVSGGIMGFIAGFLVGLWF